MIWSKFIECSCGTEGIMISNDYIENEEPIIDLAFFKYGYNPEKMGLYQKLRYCWQILSTGKPFIDEITLNKDNTKVLITELNNFIKKPIKTDNIINLGK